MKLTVMPHLWMAGLIRMIQNLVGIRFDLDGLDLDGHDVELDLCHGRD